MEENAADKKADRERKPCQNNRKKARKTSELQTEGGEQRRDPGDRSTERSTGASQRENGEGGINS